MNRKQFLSAILSPLVAPFVRKPEFQAGLHLSTEDEERLLDYIHRKRIEVMEESYNEEDSEWLHERARINALKA